MWGFCWCCFGGLVVLFRSVWFFLGGLFYYFYFEGLGGVGWGFLVLFFCFSFLGEGGVSLNEEEVIL